MRDPKDRLARWILRLQPYDFEIIHRSGLKHTDVDPLSRNPVNPPDSQNDPLEIDDRLCSLQKSGESNKKSQRENIAKLQKADKRLKPIINKLRKLTTNPKHPSECIDDPIADFSLRNGVLYKASPDEDSPLWLLCIPKSMRAEILREVHEDNLKHMGLYKTYSMLKSRFFWPGMYVHCQRFLRSCQKCQFFNRRNFNVPGPMQPVAPPKIPFERIGIDFQGPFPMTYPYHNKYVFVAVDHLTRYTEAWPTTNIDAKCAIAALEKHVIFKHSCPREILADQGSCFTSKEFKDFCAKYKIKLLFTAAYKPDTNGVCERKNDVLKSIIAKHVNNLHSNWDQLVPAASFAANIATHRITGVSPYKLLYGFDPILPSQIDQPMLLVDDEQFEPIALRTRQRKNLQTARKRTIQFQKRCKAMFDVKHKPAEFKIGQKVAYANFHCPRGLVRKWVPKWTGPFIITRQTGVINYELKDARLKPNPNKEYRVVSVRHLKPFYEVFISDTDSPHSSQKDVIYVDHNQLPDSQSEDSDFNSSYISNNFNNTIADRRKFADLIMSRKHKPSSKPIPSNKSNSAHESNSRRIPHVSKQVESKSKISRKSTKYNTSSSESESCSDSEEDNFAKSNSPNPSANSSKSRLSPDICVVTNANTSTVRSYSERRQESLSESSLSESELDNSLLRRSARTREAPTRYKSSDYRRKK
jgi:transposase InsO family protein